MTLLKFIIEVQCDFTKKSNNKSLINGKAFHSYLTYKMTNYGGFTSFLYLQTNK